LNGLNVFEETAAIAVDFRDKNVESAEGAAIGGTVSAGRDDDEDVDRGGCIGACVGGGGEGAFSNGPGDIRSILVYSFANAARVCGEYRMAGAGAGPNLESFRTGESPKDAGRGGGFASGRAGKEEGVVMRRRGNVVEVEAFEGVGCIGIAMDDLIGFRQTHEYKRMYIKD
jgi:hypothetical protein